MAEQLKILPLPLRDGVSASGSISIRWLAIFFAVILLTNPLLASVSQARDVRVDISFTGTVRDTSHDVIPDVGGTLFADVVTARSKGTFGASTTTIVTEFVFVSIGAPCPTDWWYTTVAYSRAVLTFARGDQLYGSSDDGYLCLDVVSGDYYGSANVIAIGGTGRFEGATGDFEAPFSGRNLTFPAGIPFGFGSIDGAMLGTIHLQ